VAALTAEFWQERLQLLLIRSGGHCEARTPKCAAPGGVLTGMDRRRMSIQHRRARGMGGTDDPDANELGNLLIVCGDGVSACHGWIEVDERAEAERRGLWVRHTPAPVWEYPLVLWSGRRVLLHPTQPLYLPHPDPWDLQALRAAADTPS
jgi:hypothetical protein